eukprot:scaffold13.g214.t1
MGLLCAAAGLLLFLIFGGYLLPHLLVTWFYKTKNLKKAYGAQWALVTGSSSGIGKAIARRLAAQGLNVVLVALGDPLLDSAAAELSEAYPDVQFRKARGCSRLAGGWQAAGASGVPANLGQPGYLDAILKATADIDIQVVFCNAGYVLTGFFDTVPLDRQLENLQCNAVSAVSITHALLERMRAKGLRGCFVYTSSAAAAIPNPFSVLYASTKSFLSSFGASLAAEVRPYGIDVLVFHPSPVASRFYDKASRALGLGLAWAAARASCTYTRPPAAHPAEWPDGAVPAHKLDAMEFFKKFAVDPEELPDTVFASIGRMVWRDVGATAVAFRLLMKVVDYNLMAFATAVFAPLMPDFKRYTKKED